MNGVACITVTLALILALSTEEVSAWGAAGTLRGVTRQQQHLQSASSRLRQRKNGDMSMRWGLKGAGQSNKPMGEMEDGETLRDKVPFELRGFSLPAVVFSVGALLTGSSFWGYIVNNEGGGDGALSSLGFVYGIPVFLIGLSLFYAEIQPVVVISDEATDALYEQKKTDTMEKIRADVTRHRYGDDAHLDSTLEALGLKLPQRKFPKMQSIELSRSSQGELEYTMTFQSEETPFKVWNDADRVQRYTTYFGPGVWAAVEKRDAEKRLVALKLTTGDAPPPPPVEVEAPAPSPVPAAE